MKILQIVHSLPFLNQAGTEIYTQSVSSELSKRHEVYIFSRCSDPRQEEYAVTKRKLGKASVYLINNTFRECNSFQMLYQNNKIDEKFALVLDEVKPDIVHIQHLIFLSIGILKMIKERNIPIVFTLHDYWLICPKWHLLKNNYSPCKEAADAKYSVECYHCLKEMFHIERNSVRNYCLIKKCLPIYFISWLKRIFLFCNRDLGVKSVARLYERNSRIREALEYVDIFLAPSIYMKEQFIRFGIPSGKIKLVMPGIDLDKFSIIRNSSRDKITFAFIGTIIPAKGLHVLIRAFNMLKNKNIELRIYGKLQNYTGFESYLFYVKRMAKRKHIKFMGEFDHNKVAGIFSEIDVLVIPSIWPENNPLIIREAFAARVPVIGSSIGGIRELINSGKNGFLFNPSNYDELKDLLQWITHNPSIIDKLKENISQARAISTEAAELQVIYNKFCPTSKLELIPCTSLN